MESWCKTNTTPSPLLHTHKLLRRATFNRLFMAVYGVAILALLYRHLTHTLSNSPLSIFPFLFLSDLFLAFMWVCSQSFHYRPIRRHQFLDNLHTFLREKDLQLPPLDIFICTADPHKEPPMGTVNTALSVMSYDYPPHKLSVYLSDDAGSQVTLFAFVEAAKFARHWLPFCRDNKIMSRCPHAYFSGSSYTTSLPEADELKVTIFKSNMVLIKVFEHVNYLT